MITEKDLREAIAECQGVRNPTASTCIKLAAYYTILDNISHDEPPEVYSGYSGATEGINIDSESEFAGVVNGMRPDDVWDVIDELMSTVMVVNPRLYQAVIRKLKGRG